MSEEIKPCVNTDCGYNVAREDDNIIYKNGCGAKIKNMKKCNIYRPEKPKRPITVEELFDAGATHIDTPECVFSITAFWIDTNRVGIRDGGTYVKIKDMIMNNYRWTADRKTWHDFYVEDV